MWNWSERTEKGNTKTKKKWRKDFVEKQSLFVFKLKEEQYILMIVKQDRNIKEGFLIIALKTLVKKFVTCVLKVHITI